MRGLHLMNGPRVYANGVANSFTNGVANGFTNVCANIVTNGFAKAFAFSLTFTLAFVSPSPVSAQIADYRSVVPANAESDAGLFTVHRVGDRLLFEIPDGVLGRDMALMSRYAKV